MSDSTAVVLYMQLCYTLLSLQYYNAGPQKFCKLYILDENSAETFWMKIMHKQ